MSGTEEGENWRGNCVTGESGVSTLALILEGEM